MDLSLVVLSRSSRLLNPHLLSELDDLGTGEVLSVEERDTRVDYEALLKTTRGVRILILQNPCTPGEAVNHALTEARGDFVLVLWNDMVLPELSLYAKVLRAASENSYLCAVPELKNRGEAEIPSILVPTTRQSFQVLPMGPEDHVESLFPYDYVGLYHRKKFLLTGGYDPLIRQTWWQKADFGMRTHLWGERIVLQKGLRLSYRGDLPQEDQSPGPDYRRFFLKNLAPRFQTDQGFLPWSLFFSFWRRSGLGFWKARKEFQTEKAWVHTHRYRFKMDPKTLTEIWGSFS